MAFIDSDYIGRAITTAKRDALTPAGDVINQFIADADAIVTSACARAGYSVSPSTPPTGQALSILRLASLSAYLTLAGPMRRDVTIPDQVFKMLIDPGLIADGTIQLPGLTADALGGIGGARVTATTQNSDDVSSAPIFTRTTLSGF